MPFDDQPDVDRVIVAAADELLRPVERIDEEIGVAMCRDAAGGDFLLGDDRNARRGLRQGGEDDQLSRTVRFGDRRRILLVLYVEAAADDLEDRLARLARRYGNVFEKLACRTELNAAPSGCRRRGGSIPRSGTASRR